MIAVFVVLHFLSIVVQAGTSAADSDAPAKEFLLPGNLIPTHYDLRFNTHMEGFDDNEEENFVYDGHVAIWVTSRVDNLTEIVLQKNGLQIKKLVLLRNGNKPTTLRGMFNPRTQKFAFFSKLPLRKDESVLLNVTFSGIHRSIPFGFYRSSYVANDRKMYILNSHFKATGARAAFPCFDEPRYKAVFRISVSVSSKFVEKGYKVLSNAPLDYTETQDNTHVFYFKNTSAPIPTYLVSLLVSNYVSTPPTLFTGVGGAPPKELRTWGPSANMSNSALVQTAGAAFLEMFAEEFQLNYPQDKMDQVVVSGFPTGLENPGLVTYWELVLSGLEAPEDILTLVGHEMAHQWFGGLVTSHSWKDIWLSEGFASYYEYFAPDKVRIPGLNTKEWNLQQKFVVACVQAQAFQLDIPGLSHPLTKSVYNPVDVTSYFDHISYDKGASVIRMWANVLGEDAFQKAIRAYLNRAHVSVGTPKLLLSSFDMFAPHRFPGRPSQIFKGWHTQLGYPVVQVQQEGSSFVLTQRVFRYRKSEVPEDAEPTWNIPITYSTDVQPRFNSTAPVMWMKEDDDSTKITFPKKVKWIVVNNQVSGYYRVNYDVSNWRALYKVLMNKAEMGGIHEINRAQIIDDAANLARSLSHNYVTYNFFLDLTLYLQHESSYLPWKAALNNLQYLYYLLRKDEEVFGMFKKHVEAIMKNIYEDMKTRKSGLSYNERLLRTEIMDWMCKIRDYNCVHDGDSGRFAMEESFGLRSQGDDSNESKFIALCSAVKKKKDDKLWFKLWEKYMKAEDLPTRMNYIRVLSCTENEEFIDKLLNRYIEEKMDITFRERKMIVISLFNARDKNIILIMEFLYANIKAVADIFKGEDIFGELLSYMAKGMGSSCEVEQMKQLVEEVQAKVRTRSKIREQKIQRIVGTVEMNHEWIREKQTEVNDWLASRYLDQ